MKIIFFLVIRPAIMAAILDFPYQMILLNCIGCQLSKGLILKSWSFITCIRLFTINHQTTSPARSNYELISGTSAPHLLHLSLFSLQRIISPLRGQLDIPTGHDSEWLLFRKDFILKGYYSEVSYLERSLFQIFSSRRVIIPKISILKSHYSEFCRSRLFMFCTSQMEPTANSNQKW